MDTLTPLTEALDIMRQALNITLPSREYPLDEARGMVLAQDVQAPFDIPTEDYSAMDGYAVRSADIDLGSVYPVPSTIHTGTDPTPLGTASVARIFTGSVIPVGADAVIAQEDARQEGEHVQFVKQARVGQYIRRAGEDCTRGRTLLSAGHRLRPCDLAILAAFGQQSAHVHTALRVGVLSIGDELITSAKTPLRGQRYDINRPLLKSLLKTRRIEVLDGGLVPDNPADLRKALEHLIACGVNCIISSGGVSVGARDYTRDVIKEMGTLHLWGLALKPGKPFAFGQIADKFIFALPGNPASVLVAYCMLLYPCLLDMQSCVEDSPASFVLRSGFDYPSDRREQILRACASKDKTGSWIAHTETAQSSGNISAFAGSNVLVQVPAGQSVAVGDGLQAWWLSDFYLDY